MIHTTPPKAHSSSLSKPEQIKRILTPLLLAVVAVSSCVVLLLSGRVMTVTTTLSPGVSLSPLQPSLSTGMLSSLSLLLPGQGQGQGQRQRQGHDYEGLVLASHKEKEGSATASSSLHRGLAEEVS